MTPRRTTLLLPSLALTLGLLACSSQDSFPAEVVPDAGPPVDVGRPTDAGLPSDAGIAIDAPAPVDAVAPADLGVAPDAVGPLDASAPADAARPDVPDASGTPADAPTTVAVTGTIEASGGPSVGATVTVVGTGNSTRTDALGHYAFNLLSGTIQVIEASQTGAYPTRSPLIVPGAAVPRFDLGLVTNSTVAGVFSALGLTENPAAGIIQIHFNTTGAAPAGFGATLSVAGGTRLVASDTAPPALRDTTVAGDGTLFIVNVPTGDVTVTPAPPGGLHCAPAFSPPTVAVAARTFTELFYTCD